MLRLNVIKANTENKIKRLEKLLQNWVSFEDKRFEVYEKLKKISLKPFVDQPVHKDTDSQILQNQLMELKVRVLKLALIAFKKRICIRILFFCRAWLRLE